MDVSKALLELYQEKKYLDGVISNLEKRLSNLNQGARSVRGSRGRHSMSEAERQQVSLRMSRYWAAKRDGRPA